MTTVRPEQQGDVAAIRLVNSAAFGGATEARIVDALRNRDKLFISLVAESESGIIGHIAFSRVALDGRSDLHGVGLGPMAVLPSMQRCGVGSMLVRAGLDRCRDLRCEFVVVLGHPTYYPRFGFVPAARFGLRCAWQVPAEVFMVCELRSGALATVTGLVSYEPEFDLP